MVERSVTLLRSKYPSFLGAYITLSNSMLETFYLKYNPSRQWYWLSRQSPGGVAIFVVFDSHPLNGKFNYMAELAISLWKAHLRHTDVPHSAFQNEAAPANSPPRQSVETRHIVFTPAPFEKLVPTASWGKTFDNKKQPWKDLINITTPVSSSNQILSGEIRLQEFES